MRDALGSLDGGMRPKLEACVDAIDAGVSAAHILDGRTPHSLLLELFTDAGIGTKIEEPHEPRGAAAARVGGVIGSYARQPVEFVRGEGARLWDAEGNEYLDFLCGISVTSLGHCHPQIVAAVREQAGRLMHTSNLFYTEPAMRLAERLSAGSLGGKVFFCNSGAEANEAALKLARKARRGGDIVVVDGAFHGRTYGSLSATPQEAKQAPFAPLVPGFRAVAPSPRRCARPSTSTPPRCCSSRSRARRACTCSPRSCCGPRARPATRTARR